MVYVRMYIATSYMTGFEKSQLSHIQNKTLFHHHMIAVQINQLFRQVLVLKHAQAAFAMACFAAYQTSMSAWVDLKCHRLPWTSKQLAVNHHMTGC